MTYRSYCCFHSRFVSCECIALSDRNLNLRRSCPIGNSLDLFELGSLDPKKGGHLDNLVWIYKVIRVRAKLIYSWLKFTTSHSLRYSKSVRTLPTLCVLHTELTNDHFLNSPSLRHIAYKIKCQS